MSYIFYQYTRAEAINVIKKERERRSNLEKMSKEELSQELCETFGETDYTITN